MNLGLFSSVSFTTSIQHSPDRSSCSSYVEHSLQISPPASYCINFLLSVIDFVGFKLTVCLSALFLRLMPHGSHRHGLLGLVVSVYYFHLPHHLFPSDSMSHLPHPGPAPSVWLKRSSSCFSTVEYKATRTEEMWMSSLIFPKVGEGCSFVPGCPDMK